MLIIETNDSIKEYWEEVKDKYPTIPFEQFKEICKTPFRFFKMKMEQDDTPTIYIKYFGKFRVLSRKLVKLLKDLDYRKEYGIIREEKYNDIKAFLEEKLKIVKINEETAKELKESNKKRSTS